MQEDIERDMMPSTMATTADKVKAYRRLRQMTQRELADLAGVAQSTIANVELGKRRTPYGRTISRIADALGVSPLVLLDDEEIKELTDTLGSSPDDLHAPS